jgi:hypothetical protein
MGKRELLIVAAFVCVGILAYELTAPPPRTGERRFSLSALRDAFRPRRGPAAGRATVAHDGTWAAPASLAELNIAGVSAVVVTGEPRTDIAWAMAVEAMASDEAVAKRNADQVTIGADEMGSILAIVARAPRGVRQTSTLTLRVPARLAVRVDGARRTSVSSVAAVRLDATAGDARLERIAGAVTGTHRNGTIAIADAGSIALTLAGANATVDRTRGETAVEVRNGTCQARDLAGPFTVDASNASVELTRSAGAARLTVSGGSAAVVEPRGSVRIDARNAAVSATIDRAVPLTTIATGGGVRVTLARDPLPIAIDAVADPGTIVATDFGLTPDVHDRSATLRHTFGDEARVALRIDGGEIVIARTK